MDENALDTNFMNLVQMEFDKEDEQPLSDFKNDFSPKIIQSKRAEMEEKCKNFFYLTLQSILINKEKKGVISKHRFEKL